jgi:hypothetical protein
MRGILSIFLVLALAVAPLAFGHGVIDYASHVSSSHVHISDVGVDHNTGALAENDGSLCCGTFAGHCFSSGFNATTGSTYCPKVISITRVRIEEMPRRGIGPEAATPPPRV